MAKSVEELLAENNELLRQSLRRGSGGGGGGGGGGNTAQEISVFGTQVGKLRGSVGLVADVFKETHDRIGQSLSTWQDLSKTGVSFGNDIMAMQAAAKGARMELGEFNEIVTQNRASLAGWGGSIDKGAKEFARASKLMYDESGQAVDQLRNMGYANKDLNEILALQMSSIGTSMRAGKEKDEMAIKGAIELATEMDLMAKMTGKSREEQMESAKKLQADQAYQAKIALQTQGMSEKEAAEYKKKMAEQYAKAEALGQGQMFKEQFLYGTVQSKEAAMQLAASGKQGLATVEQANLARAGRFKEADQKAAEAQEEAAKNSKDSAHLQMRVLSGVTGEFGQAVAKTSKDTEAFSKGVEATRKQMEEELGKPVSTEEATEEYRKRAKKEQEASEGSTKAVVNFDQRIKDTGAALMSGLYQPLTKQAGPALDKFATSILGAANSVNKKTGGDLAQALEQGKVPINTVGDAFNKKAFGVEPSKEAEKKAKGNTAPEAPRAELGGIVPGTIDGTTVTVGEKGKPEAIMPLDALSGMLNLPKNNDLGNAGQNLPKADAGKIDIKSITSGFGDAIKNMPRADSAKMPGIDINKILTDIKTTVSKVEVSNWPKEITELKRLTPVQTQPAPTAKPAETKSEPKASQPTAAPTAAPVAAKKEDNKTQADTAFQEKMLLNTRNMSEKDAAEYKKKIAEEYQKAEAAGLGQLFKEHFLNAKELSKEAQEKISAATIQSNKEVAVAVKKDSADTDSKKLEAYTIKAGDNLTKIAKAAGVSIEDIMKANPQIKDPNKIFAGAKIEIPGIKKEEPKKEEPKKEQTTEKVSNDIKNVIPVNEFAGLDEAIGEQLLKNMDLGPKYSEQVSEDINSTLPGASDSDMKSVAAQDNIDKAIARQKEAQQKLNDLLMGASEEDIGEQYEVYAQELKEANENLAKVVDESMSDLIGTVEYSSDDLASVSEDINKTVPGASDSEMKSVAAQDNIDKAIARQKEAQQKLNDLFNEATDDDLNEQYEILAQELKEANENLAKVVDESMSDLIGTVESSSIDYSDSLTQVSSDINNALPDEFGGVDEAIGGQMLENMELGPKYSEQVSSDIDSVVPSTDSSDSEMKSVAAQDNIDKAIARQKEAQQKLNDLFNEATDDDLNEQYEIYAQELKEANENLAKVVDESFSDLVGGMTESSAGFTDNTDQIMADIKDSIPGPTDAAMKSTEAQDNIDKAIERQKEAQQKLNDLLMGASEEDIGEQYEYYAQQLSEANENLAKVVDESFGDLVGGLTESSADFTDNTEKIMADIKDSIPGPTDGEMKAVEAQDNIDKAIERQKEAQQKLNDLLMGASEEDIGEQYEILAQELSDANENLAKVVDESMGDLIGGLSDSSTDFTDNTDQIMDDIKKSLPEPPSVMDEFGGVDEAIGEQMLQNMAPEPKYSDQDTAARTTEDIKTEQSDDLDRSKISFGKVTKIGANGMPILAEPKKDDKALPKVKGKEDTSVDDAETAKLKRQAAAKTAQEEKDKTGGKSGDKAEAKSLDDVVKTLEKLNTAMEKLIAVNNTNGALIKDQIKATKSVASAASGNLHGAH
jgi:LysM repeat protein